MPVLPGLCRSALRSGHLLPLGLLSGRGRLLAALRMALAPHAQDRSSLPSCGQLGGCRKIEERRRGAAAQQLAHSLLLCGELEPAATQPCRDLSTASHPWALWLSSAPQMALEGFRRTDSACSPALPCQTRTRRQALEQTSFGLLWRLLSSCCGHNMSHFQPQLHSGGCSLPWAAPLHPQLLGMADGAVPRRAGALCFSMCLYVAEETAQSSWEGLVW